MKNEIYKTFFPVVLYVSETWSLALREKCRLRVFENGILRRIFRLKRNENGEWRMFLHQILKHHINSVSFTKFMESIFRQLQDWNYNNIKYTNIVNLPWFTSWWNTGYIFYFVNKKNVRQDCSTHRRVNTEARLYSCMIYLVFESL